MTPVHSAWLQQVAAYALDRRFVTSPAVDVPKD
jgi:hypothetical protein